MRVVPMAKALTLAILVWICVRNSVNYIWQRQLIIATNRMLSQRLSLVCLLERINWGYCAAVHGIRYLPLLAVMLASSLFLINGPVVSLIMLAMRQCYVSWPPNRVSSGSICSTARTVRSV